MRSIKILLPPLLAVALITTLILVTLQKPAIAIQHESQEDGFAAEFPGSVESSTSSKSTPIGPIKMHRFAATTDEGGTTFTVLYNDLPADIVGFGTQMITDGAVAEKMSKTDGTLIYDAAVTIDDVPGRFVILETGEGDTAGYASLKVVVKGNRVFQISCAGSKQVWDPAENNQFFESFGFTDAE